MKTTAEESAIVAQLLGYEVSRSFKFHFDSKNTEDFSINKRTGAFKCWTGKWNGGDAIDFVMFVKNCSFIEAKTFVEEAIGRTDELAFSNTYSVNDYSSKGAIPEEYLDAFLDSGEDYLSELKNLFTGKVNGQDLPVCSEDKIIEIAKEFQIKFVTKTKRLIMPIRDIDNSIQTFWKYKKYGEDFVTEEGKTIKHRKVLYSKERYRPLFAISKMIQYREEKSDDYILVVEGEKDALVAYANGLKAICVGGSGASSFIKQDTLALFKDMKVLLCGDYDEAGVKFNANLMTQLKPFAKEVKLLDWEAKAKKDGFELFPKFDLADYFAWKFNKKTTPVVENNKLFGYFLNKIGETSKFRKTKYGYATLDGVWRYYKDSLTITKTSYATIYNGYDYDKRVEEALYRVITGEGKVSIRFESKKIY
ncbi:toprim domain-containing protein [Aliarcobacter skirrowii]|uniref:toprim domain-containing protein n=1 Tax=Aliarcobacter skirrowii TaxID=28200 RepID=UPI0029A90D0F|nr:toprim domain-containing protein [Aliarcobacter skirrowii]MDX4028330.1 hypothetical protein [Aliarcobacter skirrowii]